MSDRPIILCDVMDTLVYDPFNKETPAFFGLTRESLLKVKDHTRWIEFELGQISPDQYLTDYFVDRRAFDHSALVAHIAKSYRWMDGMETVVARLAGAGADIHAFSNYSVWYRTIEAQLGLSRFLQWTFVSCELGHRKPSREAYAKVMNRLGQPPSSLLFIDNSEANCDGARQAGIPAIHFTNARSLVPQLISRGLLPVSSD